MSKNDQDLYTLEELSDYKVASGYPDVRGWEVQDTDAQNIGTVDSLLVSKSARKVVYLDVAVDASVIEAGHETYGAKADGVHEFLNKEGEDHLIVPIGLVALDRENKIVRSEKITHSTFTKAKRFKKGMDISREYELSVHGTFVPVFPDNTLADEEDFYNRAAFRNQ